MEGVRVAVYVVPEPVKLESVPPPVTVTSTSVKSLVDSLNPVKLESVPPPVTVTSTSVKSLVDSLDVNVKLMLASFEIKPLLPSAAVIIIVSSGGGLGGGVGDGGGIHEFAGPVTALVHANSA
ncbi:unnamed protein product [Bathycoccus prasinos]